MSQNKFVIWNGVVCECSTERASSLSLFLIRSRFVYEFCFCVCLFVILRHSRSLVVSLLALRLSRRTLWKKHYCRMCIRRHTKHVYVYKITLRHSLCLLSGALSPYLFLSQSCDSHALSLSENKNGKRSFGTWPKIFSTFELVFHLWDNIPLIIHFEILNILFTRFVGDVII